MIEPTDDYSYYRWEISINSNNDLLNLIYELQKT